MDEGDEDENIPELVNIENFTYGMPFPTSPSRVPIMSAHDGRVPIDENFPFEPCPLRGRPHVHGNPHVLRLANVELAGQLPPDTILNSLSSCDGVDCEVIEVYTKSKRTRRIVRVLCPRRVDGEPRPSGSGWRRLTNVVR